MAKRNYADEFIFSTNIDERVVKPSESFIITRMILNLIGDSAKWKEDGPTVREYNSVAITLIIWI